MSPLPALSAVCRRIIAANQQVVAQLAAAPRLTWLQMLSSVTCLQPTLQQIAATRTLPALYSRQAALLACCSARGWAVQRLCTASMPQHKVDLAWFNMTIAEVEGYNV